jgi:hypothetical protein
MKDGQKQVREDGQDSAQDWFNYILYKITSSLTIWLLFLLFFKPNLIILGIFCRFHSIYQILLIHRRRKKLDGFKKTIFFTETKLYSSAD